MVRVEDVLRMMLTKKGEFAQVALTRPSGQTAFDYGRAVGIFTAYEQITGDIEELLEADDKRERES